MANSFCMFFFFFFKILIVYMIVNCLVKLTGIFQEVCQPSVATPSYFKAEQRFSVQISAHWLFELDCVDWKTSLDEKSDKENRLPCHWNTWGWAELKLQLHSASRGARPVVASLFKDDVDSICYPVSGSTFGHW